MCTGHLAVRATTAKGSGRSKVTPWCGVISWINRVGLIKQSCGLPDILGLFSVQPTVPPAADEPLSNSPCKQYKQDSIGYTLPTVTNTLHGCDVVTTLKTHNVHIPPNTLVSWLRGVVWFEAHQNTQTLRLQWKTISAAVWRLQGLRETCNPTSEVQKEDDWTVHLGQQFLPETEKCLFAKSIHYTSRIPLE